MRSWLTFGAVALTVATADMAPVGFLAESAEAGTLRNSVSASNRAGLNIRKPPSSGQSMFRNFTKTRPPISEVDPFLDPQDDLAAPEPASRRPGQPTRQPRLDWFWEVHDVAATSASPARWTAALATLRDRRMSHGPIVADSTMARIASAYGAEISKAALEHRVSEALILAVIAVESNGRVRAKSNKDAHGLMQLIPATAKRFGVSNVYDAAQNIEGGAAYLNFLLAEFEGDVILALAGYNAGEGAVAKHGGVPPYAETRDYVVKVLDALVASEGLCLLPPEGPRNRCAWTQQAGL